MSTLAKKRTRDGVLRAGLLALVEHMTSHELSAPMSIDFGVSSDEPRIRVRLAGIGQQNAWLNTVEVTGESNEHALSTDDYVRTTWVVSLPETLSRVELVGLRPRALAIVGEGVAS